MSFTAVLIKEKTCPDRVQVVYRTGVLSFISRTRTSNEDDVENLVHGQILGHLREESILWPHGAENFLPEGVRLGIENQFE